LDNIKNSRVFRLLAWWRRLAAPWRRRTPPEARPPFLSENLEQQQVPPAGTVSVVIPFKDHVDLLTTCLRGLRRGTYPHRQVILIDNGSTCARTLRYLDKLRAQPNFKVIACPGPFNFSRLGNVGAHEADGDFLLFLNNDVEALAPDWLEQLLRLGNAPEVGVVGATLLYPDGTLQHAGIFPGRDGQWAHVYRGLPQDHPGDCGELAHARTVPAVTAACLMIRRRLFMEMGGFDERHALVYNDVDLCRRVRQRGLK